MLTEIIRGRDVPDFFGQYWLLIVFHRTAKVFPRTKNRLKECTKQNNASLISFPAHSTSAIVNKFTWMTWQIQEEIVAVLFKKSSISRFSGNNLLPFELMTFPALLKWVTGQNGKTYFSFAALPL